VDPEFGSFVLFEQVEGKPVDEGEVLSSVAGTLAAQVFAEGDVEYPVEFVFDAPVLTNDLMEASISLSR